MEDTDPYDRSMSVKTSCLEEKWANTSIQVSEAANDFADGAGNRALEKAI